MTQVETVFLAIQTGLRLYAAGRKAFADATMDRQLILPLPGGAELSTESAFEWFDEDSIGMDLRMELDNPRLEHFMGKEADEFTREEASEFVELYTLLYDAHGRGGGNELLDREHPLTAQELDVALRIRQWSKDAPSGHRTPFQTVAGTLINIAVDYFVNTPGAVSDDTPEGKAIKAFLEAIEETDFSTTPVHEMAPGLFATLLDSISNHPSLLFSGPKEKEFVVNVTKSLSGSITAALKGKTDKERENLLESGWPQLIARAFFEGGAQTILAHPTTYLGARTGAESDMVSTLIDDFVEIVLTEDQMVLKKAVSGEGLDRLVQAALAAVAENPAIIQMDADRSGIKKLILELVTTFAAENNPVSGDILPEVARNLLEKTAANLELVWVGADRDPLTNRLMIATKELLTALAIKEDGDKWRPRLGEAQFLDVLDAVLDEVVSNPDWVTDNIADNKVLRLAMDATLGSLRRQEAGRLTNETAVHALKSAIAAVAANLSLVERLPEAGPDQGKIALAVVLDTIFGDILNPDLDPQAKWRLARNSTLAVITEVILERLSKRPFAAHHIAVLRGEIAKLIAGTTSLDGLGDAIDAALAA